MCPPPSEIERREKIGRVSLGVVDSEIFIPISEPGRKKPEDIHLQRIVRCSRIVESDEETSHGRIDGDREILKVSTTHGTGSRLEEKAKLRSINRPWSTIEGFDSRWWNENREHDEIRTRRETIRQLGMKFKGIWYSSRQKRLRKYCYEYR